ncbi:MAG TPA: hypothetical protein VF786_12840 [Terriglobales bacterium]
MKSRVLMSLGVLAVALTLCLSVAAVSRWDGPAEEMARKIAAVSGPGGATLDVQNASSISSSDIPAIRRALEVQLRAAGVQVRTQHDAPNVIRVTVRENVRGWLLIAEVAVGNEIRVAMIEVPAERTASATPQNSLVTLRSAPLVSTAEPLLDLQLLDANTLLALTPQSVTVYQRQADRWQAFGKQKIVTTVPVTRDPRGRLAMTSAGYEVYLPGVHCTAAAVSAAPECRESDDPWPLAPNAPASMQPQSGFYNSGRNFFSGILSPGLGRQLPAFYSAAPIFRPKNTQWVLTLLDGRTALEDTAGEQRLSGAARNWGSDIVSIQSECGAKQQILATAGVNDGAEDSLQAFEINGRDASAVSTPMKFAGSITALWPATPGSAVAIVRNPQGGYDAYSITLACH